MELWQLREFVVLAECLNFSTAAKHLFITQPGLSRHIGELEQELGVQLFVRNKHSVQLTAAGKLLLEEAQIILARCEETVQKIHLTASGLTGSVKIGFLGAAVNNFLVPFAVHFNRVHPKIQLQLVSFENSRTLTDAMLRQEIDVAFTLSLGFPHTKELNWKTVYSDVVSAVVHRDHPLAGESITDIANLANEPFVLLSRDQTPEGFDHILAICKVRGFIPNLVRHSSRIESVLMMVEMGWGVSVLPRHTQVYAGSAVRYIDLQGDDCRFDVLIAWKTTNSNPAILPFLKEFEVSSASFLEKHPIEAKTE